MYDESEQIARELAQYHKSEYQRFERRLGQKHVDGYNLPRLLNGLRMEQYRNWKDTSLEWTISNRIAERLGRPPQPGFAYIPVSPFLFRDLTKGVAGAGGYLVDAENPGDIFIGALLSTSVLANMGIQVIDAQGDALLPRITIGIQTYWQGAETTSITESQFTFGVGAGTPKTVGAYVKVSDMILKQTTPTAHNFLLSELGRACAAALDTIIISGSGANGQPTGILNTSGIGSVSGTSLAWSGVLDMVGNVEDSNALINPLKTGFVIEPSAAKILRGREKASGSGFIMSGNEISGYRALPTNSAPTASSVFGDWSSVAVVSWGGLQIGTDPFGTSSELFKAGLVALRALWSADVIVLRPAFCKCESIT